MSEEKPKESLFKTPRSQDELVEIAKGIFGGTIFTDRHIRNGTDEDKSRALSMIFMPLALGALANTPPEEKEKIGLIFEDLSKRCNHDCNGYPTFLSFQLLSIEETGKVSEMIRKLSDAETALRASDFSQPKGDSQ